MDSREEVTRLYREAQQAKQKARAMKARLDSKDASQAYENARLRRLEEERKLKGELDDRIRSALVTAANAMEAKGVVFQGPTTSLALRREMHKFPVVDVKTGKVVEIYINATGFEWD